MANEAHVTFEENFYSTQEDLTMECGSSSTCNDHPVGGNGDEVVDSNNPAARVLSHLDDVLRQRLNLEVGEFQESIHNILDEQLCRMRHLVSISHPCLPQDIQEELSPSVNKGDEEVFWNYHSQMKDEKSKNTVDGDEHEKTRIVLELLTLCSSISRKLLTVT